MPLSSRYFLTCPYCLEQIEVIVDNTAGDQEYTEDCEVCCHPILFRVRMEAGEIIDIEAFRENG